LKAVLQTAEFPLFPGSAVDRDVDLFYDRVVEWKPQKPGVGSERDPGGEGTSFVAAREHEENGKEVLS